jgi:hypothetical protein
LSENFWNTTKASRMSASLTHSICAAFSKGGVLALEVPVASGLSYEEG